MNPSLISACSTPAFRLPNSTQLQVLQQNNSCYFPVLQGADTASICKMNMLLHGIPHADIRQEDTIRRPQHKAESNELKRYDRVLANPPFSQNYIKKEIEFPGRFAVWMPETGKKADLMFVQHM